MHDKPPCLELNGREGGRQAGREGGGGGEGVRGRDEVR